MPCFSTASKIGLRGLNTHRRSFFVGRTPDMKELFKDTKEEIDVTLNSDDETIDIIRDMPKRKIY